MIIFVSFSYFYISYIDYVEENINRECLHHYLHSDSFNRWVNYSISDPINDIYWCDGEWATILFNKAFLWDKLEYDTSPYLSAKIVHPTNFSMLFSVRNYNSNLNIIFSHKADPNKISTTDYSTISVYTPSNGLDMTYDGDFEMSVDGREVTRKHYNIEPFKYYWIDVYIGKGVMEATIRSQEGDVLENLKTDIGIREYSYIAFIVDTIYEQETAIFIDDLIVHRGT